MKKMFLILSVLTLLGCARVHNHFLQRESDLRIQSELKNEYRSIDSVVENLGEPSVINSAVLRGQTFSITEADWEIDFESNPLTRRTHIHPAILIVDADLDGTVTDIQIEFVPRRTWWDRFVINTASFFMWGICCF